MFGGDNGYFDKKYRNVTKAFDITDRSAQYIEHPGKYHGKIHMDNKTRR